jgi:hypothetical protein
VFQPSALPRAPVLKVPLENDGMLHPYCAVGFILTLSQLMLHIRGVSKTFGEWYHKTNKTEDTSKLTLLAFKIIAILHNTRLATFIKLLETVSKGLFRNRSQNSRTAALQQRVTAVLRSIPEEAFGLL